MPDVLAQAIIPTNTGVPEDFVVNTWSFTVNDDTEPNFQQCANGLLAFYGALVGEIYSAVMNFTDARIKMYLRSDPEPRVPRFEGTADMGDDNLSLGSLPEEAAVCLSFRANYASGEPNARRRGRVFLGPLASGVLTISGERTRVVGAAQEAIRDAYYLLQAELTTTGNEHVVWSGVDGESRVVTELWIDNAFDTQRRRGPAATSRLTFPRVEP